MRLTFLDRIYAAAGPYASAWFDVVPNENAAHETELRWRALREQLARSTSGSGKPSEKLLDAMEEAALARPSLAGPQGRLIVAAGESVLLAEALPEPPGSAGAGWDVLPHVTPFVRSQAATIPHVRVLTDRTGADITVVGPTGEEVDAARVDGGTYPIQRTGKGGWSSRRYEETAENLWERNAAQVAARVDRLVAESGALVVAAAGDVRAVTYLRDNLGEKARSVFVEVDGGRAAGVDQARLQQQLRAAVADAAQRVRQPALDRFGQELGQRDLAVDGWDAVVEALVRAQVDTLFVVEDADTGQSSWGERRLWAGPDPLQIGTSESAVRALGADDTETGQLPADDVLVRALSASDASLVMVPGSSGLTAAEGIGATLRYTDAATRT